MKIYQCSVCGKILVLLEDPSTPNICCNLEMDELTPHESEGVLGEKHVPLLQRKENVLHISIPHPNTDSHHIDWIIIEYEDGYQFKKLEGRSPYEIEIPLSKTTKLVAVYSYCNLHGLYKALG